MEFSLVYRSSIIIGAYKGWLSNADKVLDIGCGNAVVTEEIRKYFSCPVTGTDIQDYRKRDIPFRCIVEPDKLPFKNKEFSVCMFNDVLHHCYKQEELINDALRVADRVLIFEMEPTMISKFLDYAINQIHNRKMPIPLKIRRSTEWLDFFKSLDFIDLEYRPVKRPVFYPFINYAFQLKNKGPK